VIRHVVPDDPACGAGEIWNATMLGGLCRAVLRAGALGSVPGYWPVHWEGSYHVFHRHHHSDRESVPAEASFEPVRAEGVILEWAPSAIYRTKARLLIGVKFDDGQKVEFTEEVTDFVLPPEGDFAARIAALAQEPIPISLHVGDKIPVYYDPADRTRMAVDLPTLHAAAVRRHEQVLQARHARAEAILDASDPVPGRPSAPGA
jgi:hypothetical protein